MDAYPTVSVIIPTYNRKDWLCQTLESLARQVWAAEQFEVIVVDDGSTDGTEAVAAMTFPFPHRYFWQTNQGDAAARNTGALQSQADVLIFIDDDIVVAPDYLSHLVLEHRESYCRIVVGTEYLYLEDGNPLAEVTATVIPPAAAKNGGTEEIPFTDVCSNNMSIRRDAYLSIGMMSNLGFPGSSIWCDIDFTYRAYQQGFSFYRSTSAVCWHRDYVAQSLDNRSKRSREAAFRAVVLFQKYPGLSPHLAMFIDKTPISWEHDSLRLIGRKLARHLASSRPVLSGMEQLAVIVEKTRLSPTLLDLLSRWVVGGHLFQGYREGLRTFQMAEGKP